MSICHDANTFEANAFEQVFDNKTIKPLSCYSTETNRLIQFVSSFKFCDLQKRLLDSFVKYLGKDLYVYVANRFPGIYKQLGVCIDRIIVTCWYGNVKGENVGVYQLADMLKSYMLIAEQVVNPNLLEYIPPVVRETTDQIFKNCEFAIRCGVSQVLDQFFFGVLSNKLIGSAKNTPSGCYVGDVRFPDNPDCCAGNVVVSRGLLTCVLRKDMCYCENCSCDYNSDYSEQLATCAELAFYSASEQRFKRMRKNGSWRRKNLEPDSD